MSTSRQDVARPVRTATMMKRTLALTAELTLRLLAGAATGLFVWGWHRWRRYRDWRILGGLFRVIVGGAIGFAIWWQWLRPIDPDDPGLLLLMLQIGCGVGLLWALVWALFLQPPEARSGREG